MGPLKSTGRLLLGAAALVSLVLGSGSSVASGARTRFLQIEADSREKRSAIADLGVSIEAVRSDSVWGFANERSVGLLKAKGFRILGDHSYEMARGGHGSGLDFPSSDSRFHDYKETLEALAKLQAAHPDASRLHRVGKSIEGRDIVAIQINTTKEALEQGASSKPGAIFMGNHHAREHLSNEVPLLLAKHLLETRRDPRIQRLVDTRDIWIIPMVNPDGVEHDISGGRYRSWRKNRRDNGDGTFGVDLNRNYGFKWGTGGSSKDTGSDVYMGASPFSEPETQAVREFVRARRNAKVLLTFHTFSELILYPWGHTYDDIGNARDLATFRKMAQVMAGWNRYKPQQSSDLYIASGDTTDWAYGELGIFAFTFELSPQNIFQGGFYPGQQLIDKVFNDNLKPCLYLIDLADNPYRALDGATGRAAGLSSHYAQPSIPEHFFHQLHPIDLAN